MSHERLDIAYWRSIFSLDRLRNEGDWLDYSAVSGPYDIAVLEQLRSEAFAIKPEIARVPTDVFVWNRGEAKNRAVTKIGVLPYRVAGKPWPVAPSGHPMTFVAQFCFVDSRDIVPSLPGDLLLVFIEGSEWSPGQYGFQWGADDDTDSSVAFEWVPLGDFPLVTANDIPETGWQILSCYGTIHRTWDYPDIEPDAYPQVAKWIDPITVGTKIGGLCPWIQGEEDIAGSYLCTLSSLQNAIHRPYPFLNARETIEFDIWFESGRLMIGDCGVMNIFVNGFSDVRWVAQGC